MKQKYRLRHNYDFQRVRRDGQFCASSVIVLAFLRNGLEHSRFGFVVNRRLGNAVQRNKIKRRMREVTRLQVPVVESGFDLVFIARKPICQSDYQKIEKALVGLLKKAKLLAMDEGQ
jgi:ribonuclease P protein component